MLLYGMSRMGAGTVQGNAFRGPTWQCRGGARATGQGQQASNSHAVNSSTYILSDVYRIYTEVYVGQSIQSFDLPLDGILPGSTSWRSAGLPHGCVVLWASIGAGTARCRFPTCARALELADKVLLR